MLVMDWHGSHVIAEFIFYCWDHHIVPLCLPPHTSHILQPLDVSCFSPLKHYHSLGVMNSVQQSTTTFDKVDFLLQFPTIRINVFKDANLKSAFSNTGPILFRPKLVVDQISHPARPVTLSRPGEMLLHRTPTTLRQVQAHGKYLLSALDRELALDPSLQPLHQHMVKFVKAAECAFARTVIQEKELVELKQAAEARAVKASRRQNYIQDGGVLQVERTLQLIEEKETKQREETEKKQRNAAARAARAAQKSNNTGACP